MTPEEFRVARAGLGLDQAGLAEKLEVNRRSVRRWEDPDSGYPIPDGVVESITSQWMRYADRVAEVLGLAEDLEARGEPVILFAYADELECMEATGLTLAEHTALLGHVSMALTCGDSEHTIITKP
ncbi:MULTISPECIES: hypothetical protein [Corynebacterium]|uniref:hypothetical protein n=1 Tax=Corynebacterium TaxID=1716 RepID=UPI00124DE866|nr:MULTISPECIES: hypothetical protein [Corynebacterium]